MSPDMGPKEKAPNPELDQKLQTIEAFIDSQTAQIEGYEEDEGNGVVMHRREFRKTLNDGGSITCYNVTTIEGEGRNYKKFGVDSDYDVDVAIIFESDNKLSFYIEEDEDFTGDLTRDEIQENPNYMALLDKALAVIETAQNQREHYERHDLPQHISARDLTQTEIENLQDKLTGDLSALRFFESLLPVTQMRSDNGDTWYSSELTEDDNRLYGALYREDSDGNLLPSFVYTSKSQATWRLLPRLGNKESSGWHDKGHSGEEGLNLPIALQAALWKQAHAEVDQSRGFWKAIKLVTDSRYDAMLAGAKTESLHIGDYSIERDPQLVDKLPEPTTELKEAFSFTAPLYGEVSASVVPSRDKSLRYLVFTRKSDGSQWLGMAEPVDAKMFDSFILDKAIISVKLGKSMVSLFEPLQEYGSQISHQEFFDNKYRDNTEAVLGSIGIRALRGEL